VGEDFRGRPHRAILPELPGWMGVLDKFSALEKIRPPAAAGTVHHRH